MQKGNSAEFAKRDARRMYDESARDAGKECWTRVLRDVRKCCNVLIGSARGMLIERRESRPKFIWT